MPSFDSSVMRRAREFSLMPVEGEVENPNDIRMIASTCAPVRIGVMGENGPEEWNEILEHGEGCVDVSATKSLLLNHEHDQIIGAVKSVRLDGNTSIVEATILDGAVLPTGVRVCDAVRSGALKGVSIGYAYRMDKEDIEIDSNARSVRVKRWRMLEVTLTPIPADPGAGVRSFPTTSFSKEVQMPDSTDIKQTAPTVDVEAVRSEAKSIAALADSLHLRSADYIGLSLADAQAKMLEAVAKRDAADAGKPKAPVASHVQVGEEHIEKVAKRAVGALLHSAGFDHRRSGDVTFADGTTLKDHQDGNDLRGKRMTDVIRGTLEAVGERVGSLDPHALAAFALGKRDAANTGTGLFTNFVFANLITKAVTVGYQMGSPSFTYDKIVGRNYVPDYKQFGLGGLALGNLSETVENAAFPELAKAEGSYNSQVKMWGGTLSLSEQAIVSDDTQRFMEQLRQAGVIARKTMDKRTYEKLLGFSYSSPNLTTSAGIGYTTADGINAARTNLAKTESDLMQKVGLDGNPTGNMARYLVVPSALYEQARGLLGTAPGQQNTQNLQFEVIRSPWLSFSGLTGNSATAYYLVSDPSFATGLVLSTINGIEEPRVEQYDPGAVAAYKWKIYMPFEVDVVSHSVAGTTTVAGIQKATA